jgi:hypothetical protein
MRRRRDATSRIGAVAVALLMLLVGVVLIGPGPVWFVRLGHQSLSLDLARDLFGEDVPIPLNDKHDGEWYWNLARDPLLNDKAALDTRLDRPAYRAQRIGYPLLAAPWKLGGETSLVWGLVMTNLVALGAGTAIAAGLVRRLGCRPAAVLAFPLAPATFIAVFGDLPDAIAIAACLGALLAVHRRDLRWVVVASIIAVLAKDVMIIGLVGLAVLGPGIPRRFRIALVVPGAVAGALWAGYVRLRLGSDGGALQEFVAVPYRGIRDAWVDRWQPGGRPELLFASILLALLSLVVVVLFIRRRTPELAMAVPFALLVPFFSPQVLDVPINSYRGVGPMLTLLVLEVYREARNRVDDEVATAALATPG